MQRPYTSLKLSLRLPPLVDGRRPRRALKELLETDAPYYGARAPSRRPAARPAGTRRRPRRGSPRALDGASQALFGKPAAYMGEGGTIPFMGMLGEKFPQAQILVTGVLGPKSNAHGPNEFLAHRLREEGHRRHRRS